MQNIIAVIFNKESEGFQMITELRNEPITELSAIMQMALVKRDESGLELLDRYEGIATNPRNTFVGGLMGGLIGILGGPLGMLLMGTTGAMAGSMVGVGEAVAGEAMLETVAGKLLKGDVALIILADEESEYDLDNKFNKFDVEVLRYNAIDIADEVDEAVEIENEMRRQAVEDLRKSKADERKARLEEKREARKAELEAEFEEYKKYVEENYPVK